MHAFIQLNAAIGDGKRKTGLLSDLQKVFNGNLEITQNILTLAYYLFLDKPRTETLT